MNRRFQPLLFALIALLITSCGGGGQSTSEQADSKTETSKSGEGEASNASMAETVADIPYASTRYLIEPSELKAKMGDPNVKIIDIRKEKGYKLGHIEGALSIWRPDVQDLEGYEYGGMRASKAQMEALLSRLGIKPDDMVVIYDAKGVVDAARVWWIMNRYGHENAKLLNGGFQGWQEEGMAVTKEETPAPEPTEYKFPAEENLTLSATKEEVQKAIDDPNVVLLDTRTLDEYTGAFQKPGAAKAGRIPTAVHIDWANAVHYNGNHRFKDVKSLKEIYEGKGITPDKKVICYCQSGVRSAHTTYVLTELLGYDNVKNYDGSWIEWSHDDELPFETDAEASAEEKKAS